MTTTPEMDTEPDMGTLAEALDGLRAAYRDWTPYQQPYMASAAEHKRREISKREAERRLIDAAAMVGWHLEFNAQADPTA